MITNSIILQEWALRTSADFKDWISRDFLPLIGTQGMFLRMQFAAFTCCYLLFDFLPSCYIYFFVLIFSMAANCRWAHKKLPNALVHLPKWQEGEREREAKGRRTAACVLAASVGLSPVSQHPASWIPNFRRKAKLAALPPRFVYDARHLTLHFLWPRKKIAHIFHQFKAKEQTVGPLLRGKKFKTNTIKVRIIFEAFYRLWPVILRPWRR